MSGFEISRRRALALTLGGAAAAALPGWAHAQAAADPAIDAIVARFMAAFETPGAAVAVLRPGTAPYLKGYGVRTLGRPAPVDAHTRFGIASNSKSFTAAALALLVEAGKLGWDDPVVRHLPGFKMYDTAVTQMITVRDLLVHRSGLPLGAGDLMYFPESTHTAQSVLRGLQYLKPARGFRAGFDYDNILYVVAGLLIERVSGLGWRAFVTQRLLQPLGMADAVPSRGLLATDNVAGRHARMGPPVRGMGAFQIVPPDEPPLIDAAGGINASVTDILAWLQVQLGKGKLPGGARLWSEAQAEEMWKPQTIVAYGDGPERRLAGTRRDPDLCAGLVRAGLSRRAAGSPFGRPIGPGDADRDAAQADGGSGGVLERRGFGLGGHPQRAARPCHGRAGVRLGGGAAGAREKRAGRSARPRSRAASGRCRRAGRAWRSRPMRGAIAIPGTATWWWRCAAAGCGSISPRRRCSRARSNPGAPMPSARASPRRRARTRW